MILLLHSPKCWDYRCVPPCLAQLNYLFIYSFIFAVLGLELRAFTLSHSTSPIFVKGFLRQGLENYLLWLASNHDPPDLCLLSS
jgi:hypothetical protein